MIEKHPAERLTGFGPQWARMGDRYSEIGAYAFNRAHAASLSPLRCNQV